MIRSYEAQYREEIAVTIDRSTAATSTKKLLLTIVKVMKNRPAYFAEQIQTALVESDGTELLRLIVSRCEIDMRQIKMAYRKRFRNQLEDQIERLDNLLPHYKNVLKALVVGD